jgi:hypothetical protein
MGGADGQHGKGAGQSHGQGDLLNRRGFKWIPFFLVIPLDCFWLIKI